ncbi:exopolysaccharide biosynthesis protein [Cellvibrio japonicus]|uniref:ExoD n=1 Tax=Cellvibrio japonicus (strain Ueda107) TaxID=498211 RepID=B3PGU5_CELJU|nr:exopolysaccharide biosynthesis protein [Cellvibrio japonicus]ACE84271.1 ExoD [Cellvibrio japonicus Ueda107]QEI13757.1 exopolysaccharide biosynthesis protein [Cellvibrio japonicus]QEI17331.1 exopolysaccharide biosynthesis protein [Cellvibrio japonicus]QEI20908.1 exopolysaccharide biosynthesis protein [Cellvibrio japonicus]
MTASEPDPEHIPQRHTTPSLSTLLQDFASSFSAERVRVRDITESLGPRSFGFILLIFALPNSLPIIGIPGVSAITGLPMLFVAVQMALKHDRVYLPRWIADSSMSTADFQSLVNKVAPWLKRIEKLMKPRIPLLTQGNAERVLGALCALQAFLLALPIPFGNLLPALSILFIALGLIENDGVCVLGGIALGVASWALLGGLAWVIMQTLFTVVERLF